MSLSSLFGPQGPVRYQILPSQQGEAWIDVDRNGSIDDGDAYLTLQSDQAAEYVDFADLQATLKGKGPTSGAEVARQLGERYEEPGFQSTSLVNGSMCFDMLSTYRQKQTFEADGDKVFYTLEPDPDAPVKTVDDLDGPSPEGTAQMSLVEDENGILRWQFPEEPEPEPMDPSAVQEPTCVERDGILHWLFPGEVPEPGDKVMGNPDNFWTTWGSS